MKRLLKWLVSLVPLNLYQRCLVYSLLRKRFPQLKTLKSVKTRQDLWDILLQEFITPGTTITYVEFGVHEGESIKYFVASNNNPQSIFIGLDSFVGLPERWGTMAAGFFSTDGKVPDVSDSRVHFVKGWFQDSWRSARDLVNADEDRELIVHYDADLYSSTLFALTKLDLFRRAYWAIFDEFTGHETRALYDYCQAYGASVDFRGVVHLAGYPCQALCRITPRGASQKGATLVRDESHAVQTTAS
jgi:hypothetical protein